MKETPHNGNRCCALKTFQQRYLTKAQKLRATFEQEVSTWVALEKHPNIVHCFYMDTLDNQPFMVLEWIAGEEGKGADLRGWLRRGPLDLRLALDFTIDICRGLIHAQKKQPGLVHRDLKPENILIAQGGLAKITDFGLAQIVQEADVEISENGDETDGRQSIVGGGGIVGTPAYMAPEQWLGEDLDERTDIYAIGCIFYEMLAGGCLFKTTTLNSLRQQHLEAAIPKLTGDQALPESLNLVLIQCLSKQREQRFTTVRNLVKKLEAIYQEQYAIPPKTVATANVFTATDYSNRGGTYAQLRLYDKALVDLNKAIELDPTDYQAYTSRGVVYIDRQRFTDALAEFNQAIEIAPDYAPAYYNRGVLYTELQRYPEAFTDYTKAIECDPHFFWPYFNRASLYKRESQYVEALLDYNCAIDLNPNFAAVYYYRGNAYCDMGYIDKALMDYNRAIKLDPNDAHIYYNRGNAHDDLGYTDKALNDYTRAIEIDPAYAKGHNARGLLYQRLGQNESAAADYIRAIEIDPNHKNAYFNMGLLLISEGKSEKARPYLEKAGSLGNPEAMKLAKTLDMSEEEHYQQLSRTFERASSFAEMQQAVAQFPELIEDDFIQTLEQTLEQKTQEIPLQTELALKQRLNWLNLISSGETEKTVPNINPIHSATEALFKASSLDDVRDIAVQYPFITRLQFIQAVEMFITENIPTKYRSESKKLIVALRQVAKEQK